MVVYGHSGINVKRFGFNSIFPRNDVYTRKNKWFLFYKKGTKSTQSSSVFIPLVNNLLQKSGFLIDLLKSILRTA